MNQTMPNYEQAKEMFLSGASLTQVGKILGIDRKKLSVLLQKDGYSIKKNNQLYTYVDNYFSEIDTEEKAYWLGFLYADGNVRNFGTYRLELALGEQDREHLIKFKNAICPNGLLQQRTNELDGKSFTSYRMLVSNKKIVEDLVDLGCVPNKSLILEFPDSKQVPNSLIRHFIRGYFDGDGSISLRKSRGYGYFNICGTELFLGTIQNIFYKSMPNYTKVKIQKDKRSMVYSLQKGGKYDAERFYNYLYKDAKVYLERKYDKFVQILENLNCRPESNATEDSGLLERN